MVIGIVVLDFELNQSEKGEISPIFHDLLWDLSTTSPKIALDEIITPDDRYWLFFNHTVSKSKNIDDQGTKSNLFFGRLNQAPYKKVEFT